MCTSHQPTEGADSAPTCTYCGHPMGTRRLCDDLMPCVPGQPHSHAYPNDPIRRNLDAVRTGAMVHDRGSDAELLGLGLIRVNNAGWYDLTPLGRAALDGAPPNHYAINVDGNTMAFGPGDTSHAERMRDAYQRINPDAFVTIRYSRCDDNPHGPCNAHGEGAR